MSKKRTQMVALKDLQINLFVRKALNHDHALALAELIENDVVLPPIQITTEMVVIDGRHRIEAHDVLNRKEIEAEVVEIADETELIAEAYKANVGGALPPTKDDTEHTIMLLLERGETIKHVSDLLHLPSGITRRYVNELKSKMTRAKIQRALAAIANDGLTVAKAAEQFEVDLDKLKENLSGQRRKHRQGIRDIQASSTRNYKSLGSKNAAMLRKLLDKYEDSDVTEDQVLDVIRHLEQLQKMAAKAVADWKRRFDSIRRQTKQTKKTA